MPTQALQMELNPNLNTEFNYLFDEILELIIKFYLEAGLCWSCWIKAEPRFMDFPREFKIQPPSPHKPPGSLDFS